MTDREMIEARCAQEGMTIAGWKVTEDGDTAVLGRWSVATDEYEDDGLYLDDVGELTACVVGSEKFNNQRVCFAFTPEGYDTSDEVRDLTALEPDDG